jgi:hypothetical protein
VKSELIRASEGGTVTVLSSDSSTLAGVSINIPPNALSADTRITIGYGGGTATEWSNNPSTMASLAPQDVPTAGPVVYIGPSGTAFRIPASVTMPFALPTGAALADLVVYALEDNGQSYQVNNAALRVSGSLVSFSIGGLTQFQPAAPIPPLPDGGGCESGLTLCPDQDAGYCADLTSDAQNCGTCANACASGQCDGGACVESGGTTTAGSSGTASSGTGAGTGGNGSTSTGTSGGSTNSGTGGGSTSSGTTTGGTTGPALGGPYVGYDAGPRSEPAIDYDAGCTALAPIYLADAGFGYGFCVSCLTNADCPSALVCGTNPASSFYNSWFVGLCVMCNVSSDCPMGQVCNNNACQPSCLLDAGSCATPGICDTDSGICYDNITVDYCSFACCRYLVTGYCLSDADCAGDGGGGACLFGLSAPDPFGFCVGCTLDGGECPANQVCVASLCPNELGGDCALNCFTDAGACALGTYCSDAGPVGPDGGLVGLCAAGCASNANCGGATPVCIVYDAGSVSSGCAQCATSADCPDWAMGCVYNSCNGCLTSSDCPSKLTCGLAVNTGSAFYGGSACECTGDSDCPLDVPTCVGGYVDAGIGKQCACTDSSQCANGYVCEVRAPYGVVSAPQSDPPGGVVGGACIPSCATSADCTVSFPGTENVVCDTASGFCVPCVSDQDCTANADPNQPYVAPKCVPFDGGYVAPVNAPNPYVGPPFNPGGGRCGCSDTSQCNGGYTCTPTSRGFYLPPALPGVCGPPCTYQNGVDSCYLAGLYVYPYPSEPIPFSGTNQLYCNTFTGACQQCLDDYDCSGSTTAPFCTDSGACIGCRNADDCATSPFPYNSCHSQYCGNYCLDSSECPTDGGYSCVLAPSTGSPGYSFSTYQCLISCAMGDDAGLGSVSDAGNPCPTAAPLCASYWSSPDPTVGVCAQCLGPQDTTDCGSQGMSCGYLMSEQDFCQGISCGAQCSGLCSNDAQCDPDAGYTCLESNYWAPEKTCSIACVMGDDAGLGTVSDSGNPCPPSASLCQSNSYSADPTIGICAACLGLQDTTTCKPQGRSCPAGQHEYDWCDWVYCSWYCAY